MQRLIMFILILMLSSLVACGTGDPCAEGFKLVQTGPNSGLCFPETEPLPRSAIEAQASFDSQRRFMKNVWSDNNSVWPVNRSFNDFLLEFQEDSFGNLRIFYRGVEIYSSSSVFLVKAGTTLYGQDVVLIREYGSDGLYTFPLSVMIVDGSILLDNESSVQVYMVEEIYAPGLLPVDSSLPLGGIDEIKEFNEQFFLRHTYSDFHGQPFGWLYLIYNYKDDVWRAAYVVKNKDN